MTSWMADERSSMKRKFFAVGVLIAVPLLLSACGEGYASSTDARSEGDQLSPVKFECPGGLTSPGSAINTEYGQDAVGQATPGEALSAAFADQKLVIEAFPNLEVSTTYEGEAQAQAVAYSDGHLVIAAVLDAGAENTWLVSSLAICGTDPENQLKMEAAEAAQGGNK
jgi:hypothetical protein